MPIIFRKKLPFLSNVLNFSRKDHLALLFFHRSLKLNSMSNVKFHIYSIYRPPTPNKSTQHTTS